MNFFAEEPLVALAVVSFSKVASHNLPGLTEENNVSPARDLNQVHTEYKADT
jgi:hypothetical protein